MLNRLRLQSFTINLELDIAISDFFDIVNWEENISFAPEPFGQILMKGEINNESKEIKQYIDYFGMYFNLLFFFF